MIPKQEGHVSTHTGQGVPHVLGFRTQPTAPQAGHQGPPLVVDGRGWQEPPSPPSLLRGDSGRAEAVNSSR